MEKVFAFDIGTGSLGLAVREGNKILEARSLIIPPEFASTKEQRTRRRQFRTRIAHKEREKWLKEQCRAAGIEVLEGRNPGDRKKSIPTSKGDPRLEREFAVPGDQTVYTSCLLRILLLRGERLEGWQIYKALHSAIQRRGYDPDIPWKRGAGEKEDDEKENKESVSKFEEEFRNIVENREEYLYPCYYDAYKMRLWNPNTNRISFRQEHNAGRARKYTAPRSMVEKEISALLQAAAVQYPKLAGKIDYIMYGPPLVKYASYDPELRNKFGLKEGGEADWQGALGQKIPRFDNRIVDKCALIPSYHYHTYHTCRASDILAIQVAFLMKLINMRYLNYQYQECQLSPEDIRKIFEEKKTEASNLKKGSDEKEISPEKIAGKYKFTPTAWKNWLAKNRKGNPLVNHEVVEPPRISGRSRFCRPALSLIRELILSGESPWQFYHQKIEEITNEDPKKGLVVKDLEFLLNMPDEWSKIYIPQMSLAEKYLDETKNSSIAIRTLISKQNNPVIRHRMEVFNRYLDKLHQRYGAPERVVIEFVREDFMGQKAKAQYEKVQRENRKKRDEAKKEAQELGAAGDKDLMKLMLLKQQGEICLYTGEGLSKSDLNLLEIDHAVPRHGKYNGSDSILNKVVTKIQTNREKGDLTPFEFLTTKGQWQAYCERIRSRITTIGRRKARLLTAEHPEEVDEKYMALAETAWIARLARDIVCLKFGWQPGAKDEAQRVFVVPGGLTAKVRRTYKIDSLLVAGETDPDAIEKKNREDDRHHALDAMVLSFITHTNSILPEGVHREAFRTWINKVVPEQIAFNKPALEETIYARRSILVEGKPSLCAVKRVPLIELKKIKDAKNILDPVIREQVLGFLTTNPDETSWKGFVENFRQSENGGSRVYKVAVYVGDIKEYANLSKHPDRGQFRRGAKHQGQYVYLDQKGKAKVRPVYVFQSQRAVKQELLDAGYKIVDFFTAGCLVEIQRTIDLVNRIIPAGKYGLGSLRADGWVKFNGSLPSLVNPINITKLLEAGFRRVRPE